MKKYRDIGLKLTPQRLAILDYLEGNKCHPSADDIYKEVLKKFPTMSFATVYNTLATLKEKNTIRELTIDPGKKRYDSNTEPHNHLICVSCNQVIDIHVQFNLDLPQGMNKDFTVLRNHVEFHGLCPLCKEKQL